MICIMLFLLYCMHCKRVKGIPDPFLVIGGGINPQPTKKKRKKKKRRNSSVHDLSLQMVSYVHNAMNAIRWNLITYLRPSETQVCVCVLLM